jgi:hypothetical protein
LAGRDKYLLEKCRDLPTEQPYTGKATRVGNVVVLYRSKPIEQEKPG